MLMVARHFGVEVLPDAFDGIVVKQLTRPQGAGQHSAAGCNTTLHPTPAGQRLDDEVVAGDLDDDSDADLGDLDLLVGSLTGPHG